MNLEKVNEIVKILEDKKLKNIEAFDLKNKSEIIKFIILASFVNEKNCRAIAIDVAEELKKIGLEVKFEGEFPGDWIIIDAGEILVEIFTEDTRNRYNLEKLWGDSKNKLVQATKKKRG